MHALRTYLYNVAWRMAESINLNVQIVYSSRNKISSGQQWHATDQQSKVTMELSQPFVIWLAS